MDGGYLEAELMAQAGATHVVVMARAHEETLKVVVQAGNDLNIEVMGDNLGCPDMVAGAKMLEDVGCDYVIHHIGYDERRGIAKRGQRMPSPLDQLRDVVQAVSVPVQAVGGLTIEQAVRTPEFGAPLVVLGAPLTIDADAFKTASGDVESSLRLICQKVHAYGDVGLTSFMCNIIFGAALGTAGKVAAWAEALPATQPAVPPAGTRRMAPQPRPTFRNTGATRAGLDSSSERPRPASGSDFGMKPGRAPRLSR